MNIAEKTRLSTAPSATVEPIAFSTGTDESEEAEADDGRDVREDERDERALAVVRGDAVSRSKNSE